MYIKKKRKKKVLAGGRGGSGLYYSTSGHLPYLLPLRAPKAKSNVAIIIYLRVSSYARCISARFQTPPLWGRASLARHTMADSWWTVIVWHLLSESTVCQLGGLRNVVASQLFRCAFMLFAVRRTTCTGPQYRWARRRGGAAAARFTREALSTEGSPRAIKRGAC